MRRLVLLLFDLCVLWRDGRRDAQTQQPPSAQPRATRPLRRRPRLRRGYAAALQARRHAGAGRRDTGKACGRREEEAHTRRKPASAAQPGCGRPGRAGERRATSRACAQVEGSTMPRSRAARASSRTASRSRRRAPPPTTIAATRRRQRATRPRRSRTTTRRSSSIRRTRAPQQSRHARSDKGDADAAIADFDAAIKQNRRYASAYFNRANALCGEGRDAIARSRTMTAAIKYNRRNVNAYIARGALLSCERRGRQGARRHAARGAAGSPERLCGAVAGYRGAARQAEGRARGGKGAEGPRHEGVARAGDAACSSARSSPTRSARAADDPTRAEAGAQLRGEFLRRRSMR